MNNFSRASLLCMFAVVGIVLALALAMSGGPATDNSAAAAVVSQTSEPAIPTTAAALSPETAAVIEHPQPRIAQNAAPQPAAATQPSNDLSPTDLQQLREALQRAARQDQALPPSASD